MSDAEIMKGCEKCNYRGYMIINGEVISCECRSNPTEKEPPQ